MLQKHNKSTHIKTQYKHNTNTMKTQKTNSNITFFYLKSLFKYYSIHFNYYFFDITHKNHFIPLLYYIYNVFHDNDSIYFP